MQATRALVICSSVHHHNTLRVARHIAEVLRADVAAPADVPATSVDTYGLIGFGSGVYYGRFHESLRRWVDALPDRGDVRQPAFVFSTSGLSFLWTLWHEPFRQALARKGFDVVGEFHCRGFDRWGPLWLAGGINRRHPDARDLDRAARFAANVARAVRPFEASAAGS
jgi:flavodoxin